MPLPNTTNFPAIVQALHGFFYHLDNSQYSELLGLTTPDFRWHRRGQFLEGQDQVMEALQLRPASMRVTHIVTNTLITKLDAGWRAQCYVTAYRANSGAGLPMLIKQPFNLSQATTTLVTDDAGLLISEQILSPLYVFHTS